MSSDAKCCNNERLRKCRNTEKKQSSFKIHFFFALRTKSTSLQVIYVFECMSAVDYALDLYSYIYVYASLGDT